MSDILASVSVVLGGEISGFKAAMAQARKELRGLIQFSEGLKDIGSSLSTYVSLPVAALGAAAVAASAKMESLGKGLQAITQADLGKQGVTGLALLQQSAQQAGERMLQLQELAKAPVIGFEQAVAGDIRLRAVGLSATQSAKSLKEFANAIATTGGGASEFDRVTTQLAQLSAKGKVLSQDLRPIIEAAPAVSQALLKLYGTIDSETISASLTKQGKSSQDFIAVLTDELAKLPRVTGGLANSFENLAQTTTQTLAKLGDGISKALNLPAVVEALSSGIERIGNAFAGLSPSTQKLIVGLGVLAAATGPVLVAIGTLGAALPAITAGFSVLGITSAAALGPLGLTVAAVAAAAVLIVQNWDDLTAYFTTGEGAALFSNLSSAASSAAASIGDAFSTMSANASGNLGEMASASRAFQAAFREVTVGVTSVLNALGGSIKTINALLTGEFVQAGEGAKQTFFGLIDPLANLLGFTVKQAAATQQLTEKFDALAAITPGLASLLNNIGQATPFPIVDVGGITRQLGLLEELRTKLKDLKEQRDKETSEGAIFSDNAAIKALEKEIARLEQTDKASKKALDAITKLRQELARLGALDNLLGNTPSELQVLERRSAALGAGLKTLVDAGVSPSSKAFQGFAADLVRTSQAADKLIASTGSLDLKPAKLKGLVPTTIGDTLPQDVARLLGDYAKKPIELPLHLEIKPIVSGFEAAFATIKDGLLGAAKGFDVTGLGAPLVEYGRNLRSVSDVATAFGSSTAAAFGGFDTAAAKVSAARSELQGLLDRGFGPLTPAVQAAVADIRAYTIEAQNAQIMSQGLSSAFTGLGTSIGESLVNGGNVLEAAGKALLQSLAQIGAQYGSFLIAMGIADIAFGFTAAKGIAEIAAGTALIAASSALGAIGGGGGGGGAASSSMSSPKAPANYGQTSNSTQKIVVEVVSRLRAGDLVAVGRGDAYRNRVGG